MSNPLKPQRPHIMIGQLSSLVDDVILNWKSMAGDSELEKYLNSVLTAEYVGVNMVPDDECLVMAQKLAKLVGPDLGSDDVAYIEKELRSRFGTANFKNHNQQAKRIVKLLLKENCRREIQASLKKL